LTEIATEIVIEDTEGLGFDYHIVLSRRRSMTLTVDEGGVKVSAPLRTSRKSIREWVNHKQSWIRKKRAQQALRLAEVPVRAYVEGELWPYLGRELCLRLADGPRADYYGDEQSITLILSRRSRKPRQVQAAELMSAWYRRQAQGYLERLSAEFAERLGVSIKGVKLRLTKSKWGHCTPEGVLQYNWLIMQAPLEVVNYLVAHEVCHRVHLNHSPAYWETVNRLYPGFEQPQNWLKQNGHTLLF